MSTLQLIQITPDELVNLIRTELAELVKPKEVEELMTVKEVAAFFKVTNATVLRWSDSGAINCYSINNERRFKKSELMNALQLIKTIK